tara:strand:- start:2053 stop:3096 length:1044 start_codon:yes stop_codon:yes gene_type:complete
MTFQVVQTPKPKPKPKPKPTPKPALKKKVVKKQNPKPKVRPQQPPVKPVVAEAEEPTPARKEIQEVAKNPIRKIRARARKGVRVAKSSKAGKRRAIRSRVKRSRASKKLRGRVARPKRDPVGRADKGKEPHERIWLCGAEGREKVLPIHRERDMTEWLKVVPTVLAPFSAQSDIMEYLEGVTQVLQRRRKEVKRIAPFEMALPGEVLVLDIEAPVTMKVALGFLDARCLIGFSYTPKKLFPFTLHQVPMRFMDENGNMLKVVADAVFHRDATVELVQHSGDPLLFESVQLKNSDAIKTNIDVHYAMAGVVKDVAGFFGIELWKKKKRTPKKTKRARLTANAGGSKSR